MLRFTDYFTITIDCLELPEKYLDNSRVYPSKHAERAQYWNIVFWSLLFTQSSWNDFNLSLLQTFSEVPVNNIFATTEKGRHKVWCLKYVCPCVSSILQRDKLFNLCSLPWISKSFKTEHTFMEKNLLDQKQIFLEVI